MGLLVLYHEGREKKFNRAKIVPRNKSKLRWQIPWSRVLAAFAKALRVARVWVSLPHSALIGGKNGARTVSYIDSKFE